MYLIPSVISSIYLDSGFNNDDAEGSNPTGLVKIEQTENNNIFNNKFVRTLYM